MRKFLYSAFASLAVLALVVGLAPTPSSAASHREAPLISLDPTADITDFFMFRSYEAGQEDKIVFLMDVIPGEEPSSGPNYFNFDPSVLYTINVDNDKDGDADDVRFEIRFKNEFRGVNKDLGLFLSYVALPPITALDGAGSEGLGLRQTYTVTMFRNGKKTVLGQDLIAVPSNVGPRTMPDYEALAAQGIYEVKNGIRVFAGQRDDPFYIDLGAVFDTLNLRAPGVDMLSGFNVHTIQLRQRQSGEITQCGYEAIGNAHLALNALQVCLDLVRLRVLGVYQVVHRSLHHVERIAQLVRHSTRHFADGCQTFGDGLASSSVQFT